MARTAGYISEVPDYRPQAVKGDAAVFQEQWAKAIGGFDEARAREANLHQAAEEATLHFTEAQQALDQAVEAHKESMSVTIHAADNLRGLLSKYSGGGLDEADG